MLMWVDPRNQARWSFFGGQIEIHLKKRGHSGHVYIDAYINGIKCPDCHSAHDKLPKFFVFRIDECSFDGPRISFWFNALIMAHYSLPDNFNSTRGPLLEFFDYNRGEYLREFVAYSGNETHPYAGYLLNEEIKDFFERPIGVSIHNKPSTECRNITDFDYKEDYDEITNHFYTKLKCFAVAYNEYEYVCSGHGTCYKWNKCDCDDGYEGDQCQDYVPMCNGVRFDDPFVCSGYGECLGETQTCDCHVGYTGIDCEYAICNGYTNEDPAVCSGHGSCDTLEFCTCDEGYDGAYCEDCVDGYTGYPDCSSPLMCFGIPFDDENACSGHGECIEPDKCECNCMYDEGDQCEISAYGTEGWRIKKAQCRRRERWRVKCKSKWIEPMCTLMFHDPAWLN
jgi:hypothetical protein